MSSNSGRKHKHTWRYTNVDYKPIRVFYIIRSCSVCRKQEEVMIKTPKFRSIGTVSFKTPRKKTLWPINL